MINHPEYRMPCERGFTLLEMVIAIGIFAVIAAIAYGGLIQFLKIRDGLERKGQELLALQRLFTVLERDIRFVVPRPVRASYSSSEGAFIGSSGGSEKLLTFTNARPDPASSNYHVLQRVSWTLADGKLYRLVSNILDYEQNSEENAVPVYSGINSVELKFRYWEDGELREASEWTERNPYQIPAAVEFIVTNNGNKEYRRLIVLTNDAGL